jgi:phage shock protein A
MGFLSRFLDVFRSNVNDALDRAEDPEKMIKLMVLEMEESVEKANHSLAQAMGTEKRLERQYLDLQKGSEDMQNKAMTALRANNEHLARVALTRKGQMETQAAQYKQMHESAAATTRQLKDQIEQLKSKLQDARMKEATLIARSKNAKAQSEMAKQLSSIGNHSFAKFDKYEEKILQLEADAQALTELSAADSNKDLDYQFKQLEQNSKVDDELARLKGLLNG